MSKILDSFGSALNGLKVVFQEERNFRIQIFVGIVVLIFTFYFDFSLVETSLVTLLIVLVLGAEIFNTAIEDLCNKVEPNKDPIIKKVKDMAGGAVLVTAVGALVVGAVVFYSHFLV